MAVFRYKLQSLLDIKQKLEEQEKIAFAEANARLLKEQESLQRLMIQKAGYDRQARKLVEGTIHIIEINACRSAIEVMKTRIRTQMLEVHKAQRQLEVVRQRLNAVMVERKTYEKLREKEFEEFKQELLDEEKKEVDELVSYTYHQNKE